MTTRRDYDSARRSKTRVVGDRHRNVNVNDREFGEKFSARKRKI